MASVKSLTPCDVSAPGSGKAAVTKNAPPRSSALKRRGKRCMGDSPSLGGPGALLVLPAIVPQGGGHDRFGVALEVGDLFKVGLAALVGAADHAAGVALR